MNSSEKTLAVLRALVTPGSPHQLADIARETGLGKTSVHRILQVLVATRYAQAGGEGAYGPGPALHSLGVAAKADLDLEAAARPILADLQQRTGHTVHFAARSGAQAVYVSKIEGDKPYQMASRIGMPIALHCTSIGKAILAAMGPSDLEYVLGAVAEPTSLHPVPDHRLLAAQLDQVRAREYAVDNEENERNVRCVGSAVYGPDGSVLGGISVSALTFTCTMEELGQIGPMVVEAAASLSTVLGQPRTSS